MFLLEQILFRLAPQADIMVPAELSSLLCIPGVTFTSLNHQERLGAYVQLDPHAKMCEQEQRHGQL